ncbi:nitrate reductase subunit alpha [Geobacter hydrogenophilus]|uniref:nitrate reductase (quinone) n=1 Tax=Geobacter hydrogenophilus TaxID=40983 RepID=A0A9W6G1Q0_9BACT|nr:nitrate reductase subunit alpha [Geobacter hydrogenophilus]MBT0893346.1 nitrate reductase subunit alpha [Geobacter hydrogenophilus]GLI38799.1 nitrate reductase subunit alpha [Geobacter hydrogenophilus]
MGWIKDLTDPKARRWEEFYRNRWQHDRVVRSTHGVNCTGGCSWQVYVKEGIVAWEMQATDYPRLEAGIPPYEPRGCQRGISFSWHIYSPLRIKYPTIRGNLLDLWRAAKEEHHDPLAAWGSIVEDSGKRRSYQQARGKGGFRRVSWDEALEIVAASTLYTVKRYGPDRVVGFSPIPAMSMCSYAAGTRLLSLLGGVVLSFYDWYADLPPASPETWGEKTDVAESADWYNSKYIVVMGTNLSMTRTPDVHFAVEARTNGAKLVVLSPDFSQVSKYADWWLPVTAGHDGAFWMAVNHVILRECYVDRHVPYFADYLSRYSDAPFLVTLDRGEGGRYLPGRFLRAGSLARYQGEENGEWKFLVFDRVSGEPRMPTGSIGFRWQSETGRWNLEMKDGLDGTEIEPLLSLLDGRDDVLPVGITDYAGGTSVARGVPVRYLETAAGKIPVTTVFDLLMANFGVGRGLSGDYPEDYDAATPGTPAWQEEYTGVGRETLIRFAREWAGTAERTRGRCTIIVGSGANHWYHSNLTYRTGITSLILCGCVGVNGGGLNHYTGQEKVAPESSWSLLAFAKDWTKGTRFQNTPSFHYVHSDQWRYDGGTAEPHPGSQAGPAGRHPMDLQVDAVRMGWLPFYPQFGRNPVELVKEAEAAGAKSDEEIIRWVVEELEKKRLRFAVEEPDAPENWPRLWLIWRGNALLSSAKGHEYFLRHYLGTHDSSIADECAAAGVANATRQGAAPRGKLDLVVDINFRMDTSALYSDIVLPTATWYEKDDLNTTDLHSFIHPLSAAVPPCWESRSDWEIFKALAEKISALAKIHFPEPVRDIVAAPLLHDTPGEIAQSEVRGWHRGECEAVPGTTMPRLAVVERDYVHLFDRIVSLGEGVKREGIEERGLRWPVADLYDELLESSPVHEWDGKRYPSLAEVVDAANALLHFAPETNGEVAWRAFRSLEEKTGLALADLASDYRGTRYRFSDLVSQPRRILTSPCWSGITNNGRPYAPYCLNVERLVPWRTLTGRQHFYLDHEWYRAFGEHLPTFKTKIDTEESGHLAKSGPVGKALMLNCLTPHGKWHMHTTYYDNHRMLTLSRGIEPFWLNDRDAEEIGVRDNEWVEVYNDHGVVVTRAVVSARIPRGIGIYYHAPERTISVPVSPLRGNRRAGGHNSLTRARLKPVLMAGGYGQISYAFNAWGPPGSDRDTYVYVHKLEGTPRY